MSQSALAAKAGLARPNLIALELGRRDCTLATLAKLAKALDLTPGTLLDKAPSSAARLDRYERDSVARAILTSTPPSSSRLRKMAEDLAPLFLPALEAAGLKPVSESAGFVRRRKHRLEAHYSRELVKAIAERVHRLLPSFLPKGEVQ
jgi:transcriptional regulator with XRE-family HTH domain